MTHVAAASPHAAQVLAEPPWTTLFNSAAFHELNLRAGQRAVRLDGRAGDRIAATLSGVLDGDVFVNGHSAPFGGIDVARARETPAVLDGLVAGWLEELAALGARRAEIRLRPAAYGPNEDVIAFALLNQGFVVARAECNQSVDLAHVTTAEEYVAGLRPPARRALKHVAAEPFAAEEAETEADWTTAYDVLAANRAAKGRALSLSREYVARARRALGDRLHMLLLRHAGVPVGAALVYVVAPACHLVVAWGDSGHDLPRSPMNTLALKTVEHALAHGATLLDLGISNEPAEGAGPLRLNEGLIQFKQSVGARAQPRLRLVRELAP